MDAAAVEQQIKHMISFIKQEAAEKAAEIETMAEEEYSIQLAKLLQAAKAKETRKYEAKEKELETQQRIQRSSINTAVRLEELKAKQREVQTVFTMARARLPTLTQGPSYKTLMSQLILQGLVNIDEAQVVVRVRSEDLALAQEILPEVIAEYKEKWLINKSTKLNITVDDKHFVKCTGGVVMSALDGKIICNNTLDIRLVYAYEASLPRVRHTLFGEASP